MDLVTTMRALYAGSNDLVRSWASNEVVRPLVEPMLHPSRWRIRALGLTTAIGHPLFYVVWAKLLPQPYESLWLRLIMGVLGASLLVFPSITATPPRKFAVTVFTAIFWITLPFFFAWMYFCNGGSAVWLASFGAMFLIYYHVTDWRIASLGSLLGVLAAWLLFSTFGPQTPPWSGEQLASNALVIAFCWFMGLVLALSSSNLRREQINHTLATMGIMAHELRTPLATIALIGDAVRNEAPRCDEDAGAALEKLSERLHATVRNMNHQIDSQIANARLMRLPAHQDTISAAALVREAVAGYPYRTPRERECVAVRVDSDFDFRGSHALFVQVIDNLVKNALRSLAASKNSSGPGDLLIEVRTSGDGSRGQIVVSDQGVGMDSTTLRLIFKPFFSTDRGTGHGLGLAFCQRVIDSASGSIRAQSELTRGAAFTIELPALA